MHMVLRAAIPPEKLAGLSIEQYHSMLANGILHDCDPIELLDGLLVRKDRSHAGEGIMTVGTAHREAINAIGLLSVEIRRRDCVLQIQQPISLPPENEPEPDASIVARGGYKTPHPGPNEIHCVIEVSDSTLSFDRTTKLAIYAGAGIRQYVIVNLVDHVVEDYRQPATDLRSYERKQVIQPQEQVSLNLGEQLTLVVKAADLMG